MRWLALLLLLPEVSAKRKKMTEEEKQKAVVDQVLQGFEEDDLYKILDVRMGAGDPELKDGRRRMSIATHPDKNHDVRAQTAFDMVQDAFEILMSPDRTEYDAKLAERVLQARELQRQRRVQRFRAVTTPFSLIASLVKTLWRHKFLGFIAWVIIKTLGA